MKRHFLALLAMLLLSGLLTANAQTNMAGRTYHNPNIIADMMNDATKDLDKKLAEARAKAIDKSEKKKGRKLTAEEYKEVEDYLFASGIEDGFVQEEDAASGEFIPCFDGTGV